MYHTGGAAHKGGPVLWGACAPGVHLHTGSQRACMRARGGAHCEPPDVPTSPGRVTAGGWVACESVAFGAGAHCELQYVPASSGATLQVGYVWWCSPQLA